jgi:hypothetical protein
MEVVAPFLALQETIAGVALSIILTMIPLSQTKSAQILLGLEATRLLETLRVVMPRYGSE